MLPTSLPGPLYQYRQFAIIRRANGANRQIRITQRSHFFTRKEINPCAQSYPSKGEQIEEIRPSIYHLYYIKFFQGKGCLKKDEYVRRHVNVNTERNPRNAVEKHAIFNENLHGFFPPQLRQSSCQDLLRFRHIKVSSRGEMQSMTKEKSRRIHHFNAFLSKPI